MTLIPLTEARERGLARYYTGVPCKWGHVCERLTGGRVCLACAREHWRRSGARKVARRRIVAKRPLWG